MIHDLIHDSIHRLSDSTTLLVIILSHTKHQNYLQLQINCLLVVTDVNGKEAFRGSPSFTFGLHIFQMMSDIVTIDQFSL